MSKPHSTLSEPMQLDGGPSRSFEPIVRIGSRLSDMGPRPETPRVVELIDSTFGSEAREAARAARRLERKMERANKVYWHESLRLPSPEQRILYPLQHLLNVIRSEMVRYDSFLYLAPGFHPDTTVWFFQLTHAPHRRDDVFSAPAALASGTGHRLADTTRWRHEGERTIPRNDVDGLRNDSIAIRHVPLMLLNKYAPFTEGHDARTVALLMNSWLRTHGSRDPLPQWIDRFRVPTIHKIAWNRLAAFSEYGPLEETHATPFTRLRHIPYDHDRLVNRLTSSLIATVLLLHPSRDIHTLDRAH